MQKLCDSHAQNVKSEKNQKKWEEKRRRKKKSPLQTRIVHARMRAWILNEMEDKRNPPSLVSQSVARMHHHLIVTLYPRGPHTRTHHREPEGPGGDGAGACGAPTESFPWNHSKIFARFAFFVCAPLVLLLTRLPRADFQLHGIAISKRTNLVQF